jgi:hypothetical protein
VIDANNLDFDPPIPEQPDEFTEVEDAHIIPRLWLKRFANARDGIRVVQPRGPRTFITSTRRAGTRRRFYSRNRPETGERIDDIEWSLSQLEGPSAKALRTIESAWPLELTHKATLAQLFGLQIVRGPDWMTYHYGLGSGALTEFATSGSGVEEAAKLLPEGEVTAVGEGIVSDTERLIKMNLISAKVAAAFGSMTWTLLKRDTDDLALSDQPVVLWPIGDETSLRRSRKMWEIGMVNLLEVRVPVSPRLAVLMTWRDVGDDPAPRGITARQAANLNSFTVTGADLEWFHLPDTPRPETGQGPWWPLSRQLVEGHTATTAQQSRVRQTVHRKLSARVGEGIESLDEHGRAVMEMVVPPG